MKALSRAAAFFLILGVGALVVTVSGSFSDVQSPQWQVVGNTSFTAGQGQAVTTDGEFLYIARQFATEGSPNLHAFEVDGTQNATFSHSLSQGGLTCEGTTLSSGTAWVADSITTQTAAEQLMLFHGRYNETSATPTPVRKCASAYEITGDSWQSLPDTLVEQGSGDALTYVERGDERAVYAFVGSQCSSTDRPSSEPNLAFLRYDFAQNQWTQEAMPDWFAVDDGASLAWDGDRYIYALHGSDCADDPTQDFARYDLEEDRWEMLSANNSSLAIGTPVDDGGSLVWDGDEALYAIAGGGSTAFYRFDLQAQSWQRLSDLPCSAGAHVGNLLAFIQDTLYAWQGNTGSSQCGGTAIMAYQP